MATQIETLDVRQNLIEKVKIIAGKYYRISNCIDFAEYVDAGMNGLFKAIVRYDPNKNCQIQNYAEHRIRGEIKDMVRKRAKQIVTTVSIEDAHPEGLVDHVPIELSEDPTDHIHLTLDINRIFLRLNREFREILYLHYWRGFCHTEIGTILGISGEWASKKRKRALRWFKFYYTMTI